MTILQGTGVVPGIGTGPVVRPMPRPVVPDDEPEISPEEGAERFSAAAETVAQRLEQRATNASGPAAEVLVATADPGARPRARRPGVGPARLRPRGSLPPPWQPSSSSATCSAAPAG